MQTIQFTGDDSDAFARTLKGLEGFVVRIVTDDAGLEIEYPQVEIREVRGFVIIVTDPGEDVTDKVAIDAIKTVEVF